MLVVAYLVTWIVLDRHEMSIHISYVLSDRNLLDVQKQYYCTFDNWDVGISLMELFFMSASAWFSFQASKLPRYHI
jgi:hypothetical protein